MPFGAVVVLLALVPSCAAEEACYPAGGVAGIVVATIIVTFVVGALGTAVAYRIWTRKKGSRQRDRVDGQPPKPSQKHSTEFAFDNPYFRDPEAADGEPSDKGKTKSSANEKNPLRSSKVSDLSIKAKKSRNGKNHFMFGGGGKKQRALDDSCLAVEPERTIVSLRGHDFTGLGFNICGNMRDGILVKDVLHRGPASESGLIKAGDKIINVTVSFTNIVYEDALTILSYASPYDVQLEIERVPDKSRSALPITPSGSKRLGSCSFNNSGQKLFHPLYRSQSIDDLTQIDKEGTFPSHGLGPRRSQSVGVAAHKLAAHFKNSDSKLEDKERSAGSLMLSTTGSLNEKMLANVISDGSMQKSGLQWEKRFEDTLESDHESNKDTRLSNLDSSKQSSTSQGILKVPKTSVDDSDSSSNDALNSQNFKQKAKFLDSPHQGGKLEAFKSPAREKSNSQLVSPDSVKSGRAKTMAEASQALWHLDQSIRDGDTPISEHTETRNAAWRRSKHGESRSKSSTAITKPSRAAKNNEDDSDVSNDSLELNSKKRAVRKSKKCCAHAKNFHEEAQERSAERKSPVPIQKKSYQQNGAKIISLQADMKGKAPSSSDYGSNTERVYANNMSNKVASIHGSSSSINDSKRQNSSRDSHRDSKYSTQTSEQKPSVVYANHFEVQENINDGTAQKVFVSDSSNHSKVNGRNAHGERQKINVADHYSQNYGGASKIVINGESDIQKNKFLLNSKTSLVSKGTVSSYQTNDEDVNEPDVRYDKNKPNSNQKFSKKAAHPAGMFTQINPFQQQSRHKHANFKIWTGKGDARDSAVNGDHNISMHVSNYSMLNPMHQKQGDFVSEPQSYDQRDEASKTVYISSYEGRSVAQKSPSHYHQQHK